VLIGYVVFGEMPLPLVLLGAAIVAASGIFIALRERALTRRGEPVEDHTAAPSI
jgi:drug/metabolite transporter (DMT)-like permease